MKIRIESIGHFFIILTVCLIMVVFCCPAAESEAKMNLGVDIPETEPVVKLATVLENPEKFNGKKIVMKGIVSGQCAALCEFFFKDDIHSATIYPQGFKFPRLEVGKPVTIYTEVIKGEERIVFSALGIKM